ncbi:hypothetical protein [Cognatitamlana onchidii]|uniref:hypothetical protein n=1 Tax=Cognatitamlana onchidii TaxID=2562860 RepID=UPI0010A6888F|nr:hypothetical protein [Algibacter onchidii]
MNKSIKEKLEWYFIGLRKNAISTLIGLLGILIFLYIFFFQPDGRGNKLEELQGRTTCNVIYFQPKESMAQTSIGNHISTIGYTIKYTYEVNGITYYTTEYLKDSQYNQNTILTIKRNLRDKTNRIKIKYSFYNPDQSMLDREN